MYTLLFQSGIYSLYIHIESQTKETHDFSFYFELNVNFSLFYYLLSFFYFLFYFFCYFSLLLFFLIFFAEDIERNTTGGRSGVELEGRKGRGNFLLVLINADSLIANFYHVQTHWQYMYVERSSSKTIDDIYLFFYIYFCFCCVHSFFCFVFSVLSFFFSFFFFSPFPFFFFLLTSTRPSSTSLSSSKNTRNQRVKYILELSGHPIFPENVSHCPVHQLLVLQGLI